MLILYLVLSVVAIILLTAKLRLHPFIALLIVKSVNQGFRNTPGATSLIVVFRGLTGSFIEDSGGACRMAGKVPATIRQQRVSAAISTCVFFLIIA